MKTSSEQLEFSFMKIPYGEYCYTWADDQGESPFPTKINKCPYLTVKDCNGVEIPWCEYLGAGGSVGDSKRYKGWEDWEKAEQTLKKYFGAEYEEKTELFLLFDMCKECGENTCIDENNPF